MNPARSLSLTAGLLSATLTTGAVEAGSRPTVVITIENLAPPNGTFQTPPWIGFHDGSFDTYDGGAAASSLPAAGSDGVERLAEDGNPGPLSSDFGTLAPGGVQRVILSNGPIPPLAPGQVVSRLVDVDPLVDRYFSYMSMVIPSNDAFIANGSPVAHEVFDVAGDFVGAGFVVSGGEVNDAGTEENDELPENTAFFGQMMPDTGVREGGVVMLHPGFLPPGSGGILDDPMFADADFLADGYQMIRVSLAYFDAASRARFRADLGGEQEVPAVETEGFARADAMLRNQGTRLAIKVNVRALSGDVEAAHLHLGPAGRNGPVVVSLTGGIRNLGDGLARIKYSVEAEDIVGPLAEDDAPLDALLAEMVGGNIYVNVHSEMHPGGEVRGQVFLRR